MTLVGVRVTWLMVACVVSGCMSTVVSTVVSAVMSTLMSAMGFAFVAPMRLGLRRWWWRHVDRPLGPHRHRWQGHGRPGVACRDAARHVGVGVGALQAGGAVHDVDGSLGLAWRSTLE